MAEHAATQGAVEMGGVVDIAEHRQTYESFLKLAKYVTAGIIVLLTISLGMGMEQYARQPQPA